MGMVMDMGMADFTNKAAKGRGMPDFTNNGAKIARDIMNPNSGVFGTSIIGGGSGGNPSMKNVVQGAGTHIANATGFANDKGKSANQDLQNSVAEQNKAQQGVLSKMDANDTTYYGSVNDAVQKAKAAQQDAAATYSNKLDSAYNAYNTQANDSKAAYTNTTLPNLQNIMDQRKGNAAGAMTLQQAQDPNNAVASSMRGMYNAQAQGIQNQGLADYGVLAALGGQATANTIGSAGMPVTGGQMQALQGANMGQASGAFANAQNNANNLRLQGIQAGTNQSNLMYQQGQQAIGDYSGSVADYTNANNQKNAIQNSYENQLGNLAATRYGFQQNNAGQQLGYDTGLAGLKEGLDTQGQNRQLAQINQQYGSQQAFDAANIAAANASQQGKLGAIGGILGFAGGVAANYANPANPGGMAGVGQAMGGGGGVNPAQMGQLGATVVQGGFGNAAPVPQGQPGAYGGGGYQPQNPYGSGGR